MVHEPKVFLGLVTHPRSRFNADGRATQRITELIENLHEHGLTVDMLISDRNDFDAAPQRIGLGNRLKSAWLQVETERAWSNYLLTANGTKSIDKSPGRLFYLAMFVKRAISFIISARTLKRLANIDLSHLRVLREGIKSKADWILILEDDSMPGNIPAVAENLLALISSIAGSKADMFINLSHSMSDVELGVDVIMEGAKEVHSFGDGRKVVQVSPPISNTVCANLYSQSFALRFANAIEDRGIFPSIPIDWRLNQLIMDSAAIDITCCWVIPGMFVQGSMHENTKVR